MEEQVTIPAALAQVWAFVWQTERLAACLPGCASIDEKEPGVSYQALFRDSVGPYKIEALLDITVTQIEAPNVVRLRVKGEDKRLRSTQTVDMEVRLTELGPEQTSLDLKAEVEVLGKIATLGQFVIKRRVRDVVKRFGDNIRTALVAAPAL